MDAYMIAEAIFTVFVIFIIALPFAIIDTLIVYAFISFLEWREKRKRRRESVNVSGGG